MIAYIIPTRDRPERLALTLAALGALKGHPEGAEVIVVDNASKFPATPPARLANGLAVRVLHRTSNEGAASRNTGVAAANAAHTWVVMLDDDSYPCDTGFIRRLGKAPGDVAAVSADIYLPGMARRESGGLPEVFIGCGVAIRRKAFLDLGGYDAAFNYYAEEYDLAARMMLAGLRIAFDPWFRVEHHKVATGRDMNTIVARLVRNNGWVMQRYAPEELRRAGAGAAAAVPGDLGQGGARAGFAEGLVELKHTIRQQKRTPLPRHIFDRFTGLAYARDALAVAYRNKPFQTAALIEEGKNGWVIRKALAEIGVQVVNASPWQEAGGQELGVRSQDSGGAAGSQCISLEPDVHVIGTMSPGPMLDAWERRTLRNPAGAQGPRLIAPWLAVTYKPAAGSDILTGERAKIPA